MFRDDFNSGIMSVDHLPAWMRENIVSADSLTLEIRNINYKRVVGGPIDSKLLVYWIKNEGKSQGLSETYNNCFII